MNIFPRDKLVENFLFTGFVLAFGVIMELYAVDAQANLGFTAYDFNQRNQADDSTNCHNALNYHNIISLGVYAPCAANGTQQRDDCCAQ